MSYILDILLKNSPTFKERRDVLALTESDMAHVNSVMIQKLYETALKKGNIDFDSIPKSVGDITKFTGYTPMVQSIELLKELSSKHNIKINELVIIEEAIHNIINHREHFTNGFKLDKGFIKVLYNSLVYACIESTSLLISSYVDFVKRPDKLEFILIDKPNIPSNLCLSNLQRFNESVKSGDFSKTMKYIIGADADNFLGTEYAIPIIIIGGLLVIVPLIRELIFYFYYSRMKLSEFLKHQSSLLEVNKASVLANNNIVDSKKKSIIAKQDSTIKLLNSLSEKIKVNHITTQDKTIKNVQDENTSWKLGDKEGKLTSDDGNIQLL